MSSRACSRREWKAVLQRAEETAGKDSDKKARELVGADENVQSRRIL